MSCSRLGHNKSTSPVLPALSLAHSRLLHVWEASCQVVRCPVARSRGKSLANSQKEIKAFSLTACEKLNRDNSHLTERTSGFSISWAFPWDCSPVWHLDWTLVRDLEAETPGEAMPGLLIDKDCEVINVCSFMLLTFRVICYIAIDHKFRPCPLVYLCTNLISLG